MRYYSYLFENAFDVGLVVIVNWFDYSFFGSGGGMTFAIIKDFGSRPTFVLLKDFVDKSRCILR
jgi:hypothetical protein